MRIQCSRNSLFGFAESVRQLAVFQNFAHFYFADRDVKQLRTYIGRVAKKDVLIAHASWLSYKIGIEKIRHQLLLLVFVHDFELRVDNVAVTAAPLSGAALFWARASASFRTGLRTPAWGGTGLR